MKASTISILAFAVFYCFSTQAQTLDTLVDVGGYTLHFIIFKGKGIPILFEAGGGEDATTWNKIIRPVAERTATTLITYDRAGFGKSTDINDWKRCHREFAAMSSNRTGILASGCGHFIFNDNPPLVIDAIVKAYATAPGK